MQRRSFRGASIPLAIVWAAILVSSPVTAHPDGISIPINFAADEPNPDDEPVELRSDVTGAAGELGTVNWNNLDLNTGGPQAVNQDDQGVSTPTDVTVQWSSNNTWCSTGRGEENNTAPDGQDRNLMTGYLDTTDVSTTTVTVSGLDTILAGGEEYAVYAYMNGGVTGRGGDYAIGAQVFSVVDSAPFDGTYTQGENFVVFLGLSEPSFTLTATPTTTTLFRAPLNAIEIVLGDVAVQKVPIRTITPAVSPDDCAPDGRGPLTVRISQRLPDGADPGEEVTVTERALGDFDQTDVTAQNGGTVNDVMATGMSEAGYINTWLILGPFGHTHASPPGVENIRLDYLTDGLNIDQFSVWPKAGDTVNTEFGGLAASTGLLAVDNPDLNPGGVPTWQAYHLPTANTIDLDTYYGAGGVDNQMTYAVAYIDVQNDVQVSLCVASDDAVQVYLDDEEVHINDVARGTGGDTECLDDVPVVDALTAGKHRVMVKVFQGGGANGFRLGIFETATGEPVSGMSVCVDPDFDPTTNPCQYGSIGAQVSWSVTRQQLVDGIEYSIDIIEGRADFAGTVDDEEIMGVSGTTLGCDTRVTNVACAGNAGGGVDVTWDNHPFADTGVDISIQSNGIEVATVPGTATSATVAQGDLAVGPNSICVINSSGLASCCTSFKDAIMLSDLVAGGDGRGTADPTVVGISADTGTLEFAHNNAAIVNTGDNPQIVNDAVSVYIDSVFILDSTLVDPIDLSTAPINSEGVGFMFDPNDVGANTWNHIIKDVTHDIDKDITDIWAGGRNDWLSCIGIHAPAGVTLNLKALRDEYGTLGTFSCFAGADQCTGATINLYAIFSNETDIIDSVSVLGVLENSGEPIEVAVPATAVFLTLAVGASDAAIGCDHGVFANPIITIGGGGPEVVFKRGDSNRDGGVNIADAVYILQNLFAQGPPILCMDAADSNDDESVNIADAVYILQNLFAQGPPIPAPGSDACGRDTTGHPAGGPDLSACDYCPGACQDPPIPCAAPGR